MGGQAAPLGAPSCTRQNPWERRVALGNPGRTNRAAGNPRDRSARCPGR
jgi:hypothetical protein